MLSAHYSDRGSIVALGDFLYGYRAASLSLRRYRAGGGSRHAARYHGVVKLLACMRMKNLDQGKSANCVARCRRKAVRIEPIRNSHKCREHTAIFVVAAL